MITGFVVFARENSKAGRSRSGVSPTADTHSIALLWDAFPARINGFIRERRSFLRSLSRIGGMPTNERRVAQRSYTHGGIEYDWVHS
jgi:hypothetical protein